MKSEKPVLGNTILLVDDEDGVLDLLTEILMDSFTKIVTASNGAVALNKIKQEPIDVILTDYKMPEMDGLELIKEVKKINPFIPVVMLTGNGDNQEVLDALMAGAFDIVDKPFREEVLINRIQNCLLFPQLIQITWSMMSQHWTGPKLEEFLRLPFDKQLKNIRAYGALIQARGMYKQVGS